MTIIDTEQSEFYHEMARDAVAAEIAAAVAAERERCALIAEGAAGGWNNTPSGRSVASRIAAAIRSNQ